MCADKEWLTQATKATHDVKKIWSEIITTRKKIQCLKKDLMLLNKTHSCAILAKKNLSLYIKHPLYLNLHTWLPKPVIAICASFDSMILCSKCEVYHPDCLNMCHLFTSKMRSSHITVFLNSTFVPHFDNLQFIDNNDNEKWQYIIHTLRLRKKSILVPVLRPVATVNGKLKLHIMKNGHVDLVGYDDLLKFHPVKV